MCATIYIKVHVKLRYRLFVMLWAYSLFVKRLQQQEHVTIGFVNLYN